MQFQLPTNLQTKLVAYDPQLKALARTQKKSTTKKSKYPLGNPVDLIPDDIIPATALQDAIDTINRHAAPSRYREFIKDTDAGTITYAILYHYESVWYAAWLPPSDKEADYIYGYTYAYKDNNTTRKALPYALNSAKVNDDCVSKPSGRCTFVTYTQQVTKQDVINGRDTRNWNIPGVCAWAKKSRRLHEPIQRFEAQVQLSIPRWEGSRSIFERIKTTCIADLLTRKHNTDYWITRNKSEWLPSVDIVFNFIKQDDEDSAYNIIDNSCCGYKNILHILDTPFFRKWIQNKCNESIELFNDSDNDTKDNILQPWSTIFHLCKQIHTIYHIWGDKCPLDYYQTNLDVLLSVTVDAGYRTKISGPWLVQHMPVASFFTWINKFYEAKTAELRLHDRMYYYKSSHTGLYVYPFRELEDTLSMVTTVLEDKGELAPPKRWRITEFHDYVQAEAWKITNVNEGLPQDLFPAPVKVQHNDQQWTFIQPIDTHQLAAWGQAVRNCVGNATNYAEGVRKKQHFIVLCMIDNKPQFTVQLKVSMGMMTVDQIAGISNARLSEEERESYTKVFGQALQQREEVLASA
jgi:hypothetical protein